MILQAEYIPMENMIKALNDGRKSTEPLRPFDCFLLCSGHPDFLWNILTHGATANSMSVYKSSPGLYTIENEVYKVGPY